MLNGTKSPPEGDIWFYANKKKQYASKEFPIVQSYVDICLNGCLELEATLSYGEGSKVCRDIPQDMFGTGVSIG